MDEQLRDLERRFRQSGTVDDEAAWLAARRAAGRLTTAGLEVLAHAGSAAASAVIQRPAGNPEPDFRGWLSAFETRGPEVVRRVANSIATTTVERWRTLVPDDEHPVQAVALGRSVLEGAAREREALVAAKKRLVTAHARVHTARVEGEPGSCWYWEVGEALLSACLVSTPEQAHAHLWGILIAAPGNVRPELRATIPGAIRRELEVWLSNAPGPADSMASTS